MRTMKNLSIRHYTHGFLYRLRCRRHIELKFVWRKLWIPVCILAFGFVFFLLLRIEQLEYKLLASRSPSKSTCDKAEFFLYQHEARMKALQQQVSVQNKLLLDRTISSEDIKILQPISLEMLKKKRPICSFYSQNLSGKQEIDLEESTLAEDLTFLDKKLKIQHDANLVDATQNSLFPDDIHGSIADDNSSQVDRNNMNQHHTFNATRLPLSLDEVPLGVNSPTDCFPHRRTAIVVPYRDRPEHLKLFLRHIHNFLSRQEIEYGIYVINLAGNEKFNRAKLLNVGFKEALRHNGKYDCFIFHDVDLLPEDDNNLYTCSSQPKHMSVAIDIYDYQLPYSRIFGGVTAMTPAQFTLVNGYSNLYWGWGGEDDDMYLRIRASCMSVFRINNNVAKYHMASHTHDKGNEAMGERFNLLKGAFNRQSEDGLLSLEYKVLKRGYNFLYNNITVEIGSPMFQSDSSSQIAYHIAISTICIIIIYVCIIRRGCNKKQKSAFFR